MVAQQAPRIAVVGSGVSALSATRALAQLAGSKDSPLKGASITLCTSRSKFTTQTGPKNQTLARNRAPFFDYACQYITSDDAWFASELQRWADLGAARALPAGSIGTLSGSGGFTPLESGTNWVGAGGMWPMMIRLQEEAATSPHVELVSGFPDESRKVQGLSRVGDKWMLKTKSGGSLGPFDIVLGGFAQHCLTDPFLASGGQPSAAMLRCLRRVESSQIIAIQVVFEGPPLPAKFTAAHCVGDDVLSFVANNSRKPHQDGSQAAEAGRENEHWTLLSTAGFAETQFNTNNKGYKREAEEKMLASLGRMLGTSIGKHRPRINRVNHWEDGLPMVTPPARHGCLFDSSVGLGWCGDFCVAPNVQGGALSGRELASTVEKYVAGQELPDGLLPSDEQWVPITLDAPSGYVDIGLFAHDGLASRNTHTDLVPSAIGGYNKAAHTGRAGPNGGGGKGGKGGKDGGKGGKGGGKKGGKAGAQPYPAAADGYGSGAAGKGRRWKSTARGAEFGDAAYGA